MTPAAAPLGGVRRDLQRWKRRSRQIRLLRAVLPGAMALLIFGLAGQVAYTSLTAKKSVARETPVAIRMLNPRFFGRDEQGRSFMIGAKEASRNDRDLKLVTLDEPTVALGLDTPAPSRVSARKGVYNEATRILNLTGQVRIEDGGGYRFATEQAVVDTNAGVVKGDVEMVGDGPVGQVTSRSYSVFDKGDRVLFKGGVRARINRD